MRTWVHLCDENTGLPDAGVKCVLVLYVRVQEHGCIGMSARVYLCDANIGVCACSAREGARVYRGRGVWKVPFVDTDTRAVAFSMRLASIVVTASALLSALSAACECFVDFFLFSMCPLP